MSDNHVVVGSLEWDALTQRRAELIFKKNRDGLSDTEHEEFAGLQERSRGAVVIWRGAFEAVEANPELKAWLESLPDDDADTPTVIEAE